jgi:hypothetical protein
MTPGGEREQPGRTHERVLGDVSPQADTGRVCSSKLEGAGTRRAVLLVLGVIFLAACGGDEDPAADTSAASTTVPLGERIVIRTKMVIAATPGSEPIATGRVLEESTLAGSPFCAGGTILDSHASTDPTVEPYGLIARTITCSDGTVRVGLTPEVGPHGPTGKGSWTIVSGTGAFKGLRGSGKMTVVSDPADESVGRETLMATVTR